MKFLIIRFSSIGDIIMTSPVPRCLKAQLPGAEVHFVTKKQNRFLAEANPHFDKYFLLEDSLTDLARQLRAERYDAVIDLHNNLRTWRLTALLGQVPVYRFDKLNWQKLLLTKFKINILPKNGHVVDRFMATVSRFGVVNDNRGLDYFIPPADEVLLAVLPETHRRGYVAFAIGGQDATRRLPLPKLLELCGKIGEPLLLIGGKEDADMGRRITETLNNPLIVSVCGQFSFNQSASLIRQARYVFAHDTGMVHVSAALKKQTVIILGNIVREFGHLPYQTEQVVWEVNGLPCRPCSKIGYERCPQGHFRCMNDQVLDMTTIPWSV